MSLGLPLCAFMSAHSALILFHFHNAFTYPVWDGNVLRNAIGLMQYTYWMGCSKTFLIRYKFNTVYEIRQKTWLYNYPWGCWNIYIHFISSKMKHCQTQPVVFVSSMFSVCKGTYHRWGWCLSLGSVGMVSHRAWISCRAKRARQMSPRMLFYFWIMSLSVMMGLWQWHWCSPPAISWSAMLFETLKSYPVTFLCTSCCSY